MNRRILGVIIVLALTTLACTCNLLPSLKTPAAPTPSNVIFQDDFSNPESGWEVRKHNQGSVGYKDGVYAVASYSNSKTMWGVANRTFDNIVIEVDATQVAAGPMSNNDYGVVCREQNEGDGYYLLISGDGYYTIIKAQGEKFINLVDWTGSEAINQGNATNHIRAVCNGSSLELSVNGKFLTSVEDSTFTSGDIALTATTYEDAPTEIHFDNLVVSRP
ncbi:MAG: hypothetical protein N2508_16835 [Anaerolineae bacterium]|nr:hypothetical protein [Anaerolineae bacterium]